MATIGAPLSDAAERRLKLAMDIGERTFSAVLFAGFAVNLVASLASTPANIVNLVSEGLVAFFIVFRRATPDVSTRPWDWLIALLGTMGPMLARPGGHGLVPGQVGAPIMLAGLAFSLWGKLILRRSFGLAAANRGVVSRGAYAFVRHPIYTGYLIVYIGFFLLNPVTKPPFPPWQTGVAYAATICLLVMRILAEERVLSNDPAYAAYMSRVRYRLIPGVF